MPIRSRPRYHINMYRKRKHAKPHYRKYRPNDPHPAQIRQKKESALRRFLIQIVKVRSPSPHRCTTCPSTEYNTVPTLANKSDGNPFFVADAATSPMNSLKSALSTVIVIRGFVLGLCAFGMVSPVYV